ncbi:hypothetical protein GOODEAATRI_031981 [Goodea atripinnis]|uniref:Uncharacterized protein n=1 Tax=Goodea atripinnis TaxID=208336 RepID=A0ABV0N955_9TELE
MTAFIERVTEVVTKYSGVQKPTDVGQESGVWETLVCDVVIKGLLSHVAQPFKATYVGWAEQPHLSDVRRYARHAQLMADEQKKIKKDKSEKELHLAAIAMYQHATKRGQEEDEENGKDRDVAETLGPVTIAARRGTGKMTVPIQPLLHLTRLID